MARKNDTTASAARSSAIPPHDLEAEQAVIGSVLLRPKVLENFYDTLAPEDFYRTAHGEIYRAMLELHKRNHPIDLVTLAAFLKGRNKLDEVGGVVFIASVTEQVGTPTNASYYARMVKDKAMLRRIQEAAMQIVEASFGNIDNVQGFVDQAESLIYAVGDARKESPARAMSDLIREEQDRVEAVYYHHQRTGVPTGFRDLDNLTHGFQPKDLILCAARPSMGKTALALNIALNSSLEHGVPVGFFSLEMGANLLIQRMVASKAKINSLRLRDGKLDGEGWNAVVGAHGTLYDAPIYVCDEPAMTPQRLRGIARRLKTRQGIGLIVVDYLQLMRNPEEKSREREIASIGASLKALAKELDLPVLALAQLSRKVEERKDKIPELSDLRESGALEQDADVIFFLYRPDAYVKETKNLPGTCKVFLEKQRNGPTGYFELNFNPPLQTFTDRSYKREEEEIEVRH